MNTMSAKSKSAFLAIAIAWLFYLCSFIARVEPSVLAVDLMQEFSISSYILGGCVSIMYLAYVPLQIPCGILIDKLGIRKMIFFSGLLCALGTFLFGIAESVWCLKIGRFCIGAASAPAFLCCGKVAAEYFPKDKFSLLMGLSMAIGCSGGVFGTVPFAMLVDKIGWRNSTFIISIACFIVAFLALIFIKNSEEKVVKNEMPLLLGVKNLVKNKKIWLIGFYGMIAYLPLSALAELWVVPFVQLRYALSTDTAAFSASVIFIGFGAGGIVAAWCAKKINSYKKTIILFTIGMTLSFSAVIYSDAISYNVSLLLMLFGGAFAGANTLCFGLAYNFVPKEYAGTSGGFVNTLIMVSGIFQKLLGWVLDFLRDGAVSSSGAPVYDLTMYRGAFYFVLIFMLIANIVTFWLPDMKERV